MSKWRTVRDAVRARPLLADSLLAAALFTATALLIVSLPRDEWPANWTTFLLWDLVGLATVAIRRRWPWVAIGVLAAHTLAAVVLGHDNQGIAILVITYTAAAYLPVRPAAAAVVLLWLPGLVAATALERYRTPPLELPFVAWAAFNVMVALVAFLVGRVMFTRRRYVAALMERALTAEQTQRALAAQAVADERHRIARELHDVVAHHVSVMGVLATGSRRALRSNPDAADEALVAIEETGRTALREMRRLLDVLRTEPDPQPGDGLAPQPGVSGLDTLVEQVRDAGLPVSLHTSGTSTVDGIRLEPAMGLTVYRIVQEALTNVLKHGGPGAMAEVRLDVGSMWLTLEVFDTGRGPVSRINDGVVGHGLLGMRERVALFGGTLRTGPRPGGGFRVYAKIPLEEGTHG